MEPAKYCQGDKSLHGYFDGLLTLLNEEDSMTRNTVPPERLPNVLNYKSYISQFLMNLHPILPLEPSLLFISLIL